MVVPENSINNIMGGLESTGGVRLHTHRRKLKQRFDIIKKLGQGTYGKVQLGVNKETGQEVAIKTIKKCKIETEADLIRIRREIQIMSSLRHPYIIHIYEVFENKDKMVLVMEYAAGGELYDYLSERKVLQENEARRIFRQIAMAVYYCHKHQICHRDLKLENILLDEEGNAKIADFGLSNVFDSSRLLSTFCGSPLYASPEIVKGIPYHGPEVDCWSLGVLLYTLVYGTMPFDGSNFKRLVRQISQGEYYEPKNPSNASKVIRGLLTVDGEERLDIKGVCEHSWINEGEDSCMDLAVEFSARTPVRLDLLLALAPQSSQIPQPAPEELEPVAEKPMRSQSLGSLANVQPNFTTPSKPKMKTEEISETPEVPVSVETKEKKKKARERSTSRSRKKDAGESSDSGEKPKKKSVKKKKPATTSSENSITESRGEMAKVVADARKITEGIPREEAAAAPEEVGAGAGEEAERSELPGGAETPPPPPPATPPEEEEAVGTEPTTPVPEETPPPPPPVQEKPRPEPPRRKSKVFEAAEAFSRSPTSERVPPPPKKVFLPGVKVSDAKAAFERRNSITANDKKPSDFNLASTVHLDKLVQSELNKETGVDEDRAKKENAIKVITNAIEGEKKASTLPRRKLSQPLVNKPSVPATPKAEPEHMVANTKVSQVIYPTPVPPPRPSLVKQDSSGAPREHIIPIRIEREEDKEEKQEKAEASAAATPQPQPPVLPKQSSISSKTSSTSSLGRQDSDSSSGEPIRKSPREVIIPIAVEGGGYVTPSPSALSRISSVTENTEEAPLRGFGLRSTRRRMPQLDTADSVSSDEDDDNFEILTAENLFSTLLSRVRSLTQRLNDDETRPAFPRLFSHHPFFENHARRLTEARSFSQADPTPWRRKRDSATSSSSSSTLPRDFTTKSLRRLLSQEGINSARKGETMKPSERPPVYQRKVGRTVSDSARPILENGHSEVRAPPDTQQSKIPHRTGSVKERGRNEKVNRNKIPVLEGKSQEEIRGEEAERTDKETNGAETTIPREESTDEEKLEDLLLRGRLSSLERVKKYLEELDRTIEEESVVGLKGGLSIPEDLGPPRSKSPLRSHSLNYDPDLLKYSRPKSYCIPEYSHVSDFDRYLDFKRTSFPERSYGSLRRGQTSGTNSYDKYTSLRRGMSVPKEERPKEVKTPKKKEPANGTEREEPPPAKPGKSVLEKYLYGGDKEGEKKERTRKVSRFLRPDFYDRPAEEAPKKEKEKPKPSRIDKAIKSLRRNSVGQSDDFSESKLLKRAVSLEDLKSTSPSRSRRASSLKPDEEKTREKIYRKKAKTTKKGGFFDSIRNRVASKTETAEVQKGNKSQESVESRQARIADLKKLDLGGGRTVVGSAESTPTGDCDEGVSQTDNSDTWSSSDYAEGRHDAAAADELTSVSERIRRKSFYTRFNQPTSARRSLSTSTSYDRKRYF